MTDDWLESLDTDFAELIKKEEARPTRARMVGRLLDIFFGLWLKFDLDRGVRMQLTPFEWEFVDYRGHKEWKLEEDYNFDAVTEMELLDSRFDHNQALRGELYRAENITRIRIVFELADWKTEDREGVTPYLLYDAPLETARISDAWSEMKKVVSPWQEAHIRGDQELFWDWVKSNYMELPKR